MSKQKEEPKAKKIDYEKEFFLLLETMNDLGLQIQVAVKNTKIRLAQEQQKQQEV